MPVTLQSDALITLEAAYEHIAGASSGDRDDQVERLINAASHAAEKWCGRKLAARTFTLVRPQNECGGRRILQVAEWPIVSITEIREYFADLSDYDTVDSSDYELHHADGEDGQVLRVSGDYWESRELVKLTYVGGYGWSGGAYDADENPWDLQEAIALWVAYLDQKLEKKAHLVESAGIERATAQYFLRKMPQEVELLLTPYRRVF